MIILSKIGVIFASFQSVGILLCIKEVLMSLARASTNTRARIRGTAGLIPSGPGAEFRVSRFMIILSKTSIVILNKLQPCI